AIRKDRNRLVTHNDILAIRHRPVGFGRRGPFLVDLVSQKSPPTRDPLESILCTDELDRRSRRPPDYETENRALVALAQALTDSPRTVLQTLANTILEVLQCDS